MSDVQGPGTVAGVRGARGGTTIADLLASAERHEPGSLGELTARLVGVEGLFGRVVPASPARTASTASMAGEAGSPATEVEVRGLAHDSRRVGPGWLFAAVPGDHVDGHDFVASAASRGAVAVLVERAVPGATLPQLVVTDVRRALAEASAWWYGDPSHELAVVGVTGTDGKSTTCALAVAALEAAGIRTGMTSTVELRIGGVQEPNPAHVTTPQAPELQRALRAMVRAGDRLAVIETTSHGLALERVAAIAYDVAILTNLSHEHLELHGTFDAYRAAKLRLFQRLGDRSTAKSWPPRIGIVNRDDPSAPLFESAVRESGARLITYGADPTADVRAESIEDDGRRLRVAVAALGWRGRLELRLAAGRFNAWNALAVVALGEGLGLDPEAIRAGLESVAVVTGRMERIDVGQPFGVVVDYAHSPAALQAVLDLLAPLAAAQGGSLIAVFGSAGERDVAKRSVMGRIAGERCRMVVATDEDPRGEDSMAILDEIARGAESTGRRRGQDLLLIPDRPAAIAAAFERARPGDIVLLAGKGHERSIIVGREDRPWDERASALAALAALGYA